MPQDSEMFIGEIFHTSLDIYKSILGTFLVDQWLRLCLPTQGVHVQLLVREQDPTCLFAKKQNMKQKQYCNKFNKDFKCIQFFKNVPNTLP